MTTQNRYGITLNTTTRLTDADCERIAAAVAAAPKVPATLHWRDIAVGAVFSFTCVPNYRYVRLSDGFQSLQTGATWIDKASDLYSDYAVTAVSATLTWPQIGEGLWFAFADPHIANVHAPRQRHLDGYRRYDPSGPAHFAGFRDHTVHLTPAPTPQTASHNTVVTAPGAPVADKNYLLPAVGTIYLDVERVRQAVADADTLRCPFVTLAPDGAMRAAEGNTVLKDLAFRVARRGA